jgi:adenylate kinase family enzyme
MSSITTATVPTGHSGCDHQIRWPGRPSAPRITGAPCVGTTGSADSSTSTAELHERVCAPFRRLDDHDWNYGFIVDGFPRNQPQARFFLESYDLDAVILLEVPDRVVEERILSRRLCSRCGLDYNLISHRPAVPEVCDVCGGQLVQRLDDTPEAVRVRLRDYHAKTRPILDLFRAKEVVVKVDATQPRKQVQAELCRHLGVETVSA